MRHRGHFRHPRQRSRLCGRDGRLSGRWCRSSRLLWRCPPGWRAASQGHSPVAGSRLPDCDGQRGRFLAQRSGVRRQRATRRMVRRRAGMATAAVITRRSGVCRRVCPYGRASSPQQQTPPLRSRLTPKLQDVILPGTPDAEVREMLGPIENTIFCGGHTHLQQIRQLGGTFFFNPGSVSLPDRHDLPGGRAPRQPLGRIRRPDRDRLGPGNRRVPPRPLRCRPRPGHDRRQRHARLTPPA